MEDWTRGHVVLAAGALINSALYLVSVAAVGVALGQTLAPILAIAAMGVTFLSYSWRLQFGATRWTDGVSLASQAIGVLAGVILLIGVLG